MSNYERGDNRLPTPKRFCENTLFRDTKRAKIPLAWCLIIYLTHFTQSFSVTIIDHSTFKKHVSENVNYLILRQYGFILL